MSTEATLGRPVKRPPPFAELAELENAGRRLVRESRKTQHRGNALLKLFMPDHREAIGHLLSALEEREREGFGILRIIRDRLASPKQRDCTGALAQQARWGKVLVVGNNAVKEKGNGL